MRGSICELLALVAVAGLALPLSGQGVRGRTTTIEMANAPRAPRLPYTAEYKTTQVKTLADGTTITHEWTDVVAVDSRGRQMTATTQIPQSPDKTPSTHVFVHDPESRTNSNWSVPGQKATVTTMPAPGAPRSPCATTGEPVRSAVSSVTPSAVRIRPVVEDLGTDTVAGIEASGRRTTTTTPAGAVGNDAPLVRTTETWTAVNPGLRGLLVRSVSDDPQTGKRTKELTNLTQSEPDASVFEPPSGYEIVNREEAVCGGTVEVVTPPPPPPPTTDAAPEQ